MDLLSWKLRKSEGSCSPKLVTTSSAWFASSGLIFTRESAEWGGTKEFCKGDVESPVWMKDEEDVCKSAIQQLHILRMK